ncbi:MAG TPA: bifunctional nuclease family protein [Candidatus Eisenbacteria bacterium]|nr:bifunctional nuclease family protein [Candidatus Eisenbacteria bacterium]
MRLRRYRHLVLVLALGVLLAGAGTPGETPAPPAASLQEVTVIGVFNDQRGQHGVMLEGKRDKRRFLMLIGAAEATAIAVPLENITPPRPLTHDLFLTLFGRLKVQVTRVVITDLRNNTYFATVYLTSGGTPMELDSRPSDAIALAIRAKAPVFAEERVFEKSDRPPAPGERI